MKIEVVVVEGGRVVVVEGGRVVVVEEVVVEGGNASAKIKDPTTGETVDVVYKGEPAIAEPITFDSAVSRSQFVSDVLKAIKKIDPVG